MKMFPMAQNGVIRGDDKNPVIAAQSKVIGMTSRPKDLQMLITTEKKKDKFWTLRIPVKDPKI